MLSGASEAEEETRKLIGRWRLGGSRVLVTGCAGFLGSWLVEALVEGGAEVTCVDNLSTGSKENLAGVLNKIRLVVGDVAEAPGGSYDIVVHGASLPSPEHYMSKPVEAMLPDSVGLLHILRIARDSGARVVFMSSSEVYGDPEIIPTPESYWGRVNPVGPRSPYDEAKRFGEALCMAFHREYGVDVRIARIFNTYGPRLDPYSPYARVVTRFLIQAIRGEPITVHGDGSQTRSFTYVSDTVRALLTLVTCDKCSGVYNVGSEEEISIMDLARLVKEITGSSSPIVHLNPRPDDPRRRRPDISRIRALGWEPRVGIREGLRLTYIWLRGRVG
ncbi:MAG: NAD-dependent epimerase/dehydratase family protein [Sulfolobales archaeon]